MRFEVHSTRADHSEHHLHEAQGLAIRSSKGEEVDCRQACVLAGGGEHDDGLPGPSMLGDCGVGWSGHGLHASLQIGDVKALDVDFQRHRTHTCSEHTIIP